jgi:hypothetical protein
MYQTVMILLVTALVTIITTIVTVRVTMTGRVVSQTSKDKLRARAKRYGLVLFIAFLLLVDIAMLIYSITRPGMPTRIETALIAMWMAGTVVDSVLLGLVTVFAWSGLLDKADYQPTPDT